MRNLRSSFVFLLGFALCLLFMGVFSSQTYAQSTYGTVSGTITDSSGGAIADVQVTLTNLGTSEKHAQTTGTDGLYQFANLFPGRYRVDAEKAGFKHTSHTDVVVEVQQTSRIDLTMPLGQVTQTVEVTGETPLMQPETSSLGQVIDQREANELPLNGRNVFNLAQLSPSVVPQGSSLGNIVGKNPFDLGNFQIGGSFANQGAEYLDGQPLNIGYINLPLLVPTQDSIGEFKVQYSNLGPEWGKFSGGIINFSTKSGTNAWHGEGYEYLRARILNANDPFLKASQVKADEPNKTPPYTQNQFGATIGGAVIKDKTFVFGSYEGYRQRAGMVFTTTVPTTTERTGNFGDLCKTGFGYTDPTLPSGTAPICSDTATVLVANVPTVVHTDQLYNPLTVYPNGTRLPIANNDLTGTNPVTGLAYINPTSAYLLNKLIGQPTGSGTFDNFTKSASTGGDIDQYVARVDQNLTASQHLFGRFTYYKMLSLSQDPYGTGLCKDRCGENTTSRSIAVGWTDAISSTFTASLNASFSRYHYLRSPVNANFDVTQEGWPAAYNGLVPGSELTPMTPCFGLSDTLISCSQGQSSIVDWDTQWNLSPQFTKIHGRHTFAFGAQLEQTFDNYLQTNIGGGIVSFNGSWTSALASNKTGQTLGNDYADFLLGYGLGIGAAFGNQTTGQLSISKPTAGKQTYRALYFGDTWKVTHKLTLNLGLRYELAGPWSERYNDMDYFNPTATSAAVTGCSGTLGSTCPGDLFLIGNGTNTSRNALPLPKHEVSPRLGVAYALNPKTVIRAGYGVFFIPNDVSFQTNAINDAVNLSATNFYASDNHGLSPNSTLNQNTCTLSGATAGSPPPGGLGNVFTCANPGPFGLSNNLNAPAGRNPLPNVSAFGVNQSSLTSADYAGYKPGYVEQWNLDIQRELPAGFFVDIAYAGAHGVHLQQYSTNVDQIPDSLIAGAAAQYAANPTQLPTIAQTVGAANYPFVINGVTGSTLPGALGPTGLVQGQLERPFPQFSGLNLYGDPCCSSRYDSLQLTVTKRFKEGGTLLVAYTNSKLLSNTDTLTSWLEGATNGGVGGVQDWNNMKGEYSLSSQDVSQRLIINYVLDLPFGHGKRFASDATGIKDKVIAGWGIDGVTTLQRGFPLKISDSDANLLSGLGLGTGTMRPNEVPGCDKTGPRTTIAWFNTACFVDPAPYTFGDEPRADQTLRQDGIINFDFAVFKRTYFGPDNKLNLEFRSEFFNLFNRNQYAAPGTALGASNFGVVSGLANLPRLVQFGLKLSF
ncbi:MAG: TonB-dependent receptor [Candidatus Acidiferrum sp.]